VVTLRAALSKLEECSCGANEDKWRCILAKSKRLMPELERMGVEMISKEDFLGILSRHINESFEDYVSLAVLESFDIDASESEVTLGVGKLV
jgi:hypothetical protein